MNHMTALEMQTQLRRCHSERYLAALAASIDPRATPRGSREEEIASVRESYVATAVTEIATLRAELFGAEIG
jgi:hypothetical protein